MSPITILFQHDIGSSSLCNKTRKGNKRCTYSPLVLSFPFHTLALYTSVISNFFQNPKHRVVYLSSEHNVLCFEIFLLQLFTWILTIYVLRLVSGIPLKTFSLKVSLDQEILIGAFLILLDSYYLGITILYSIIVTCLCVCLFIFLSNYKLLESRYFSLPSLCPWKKHSSWIQGYSQG